MLLLLCAVIVAVCANAATSLDPQQGLVVSSEPLWSHFAHFGEKRADALYASDTLAHKVFSGFERKLHPILEQLHKKLPAKKVDVTHIMLPMRDGVRLSTFVIRPKDTIMVKRATMFCRSPYGPTSDMLANAFLAINQFVAVIQDQRGTFASKGKYTLWTYDSEDGFDTLAWIEKQPWSNGRVYTSGISADGLGTGGMLLTQPKQLKGQVLMWTAMDGHGIAYPGGVFRMGLISGWMTLMAPLTRGVSLTKVLPDVIAHSKVSDWWLPTRGPGRYQQTQWPTIHIAGWWDIFQGHQIDMFNQVSALVPQYKHYLVVGPMGHCIVGLFPNLQMDKEEAKGIINGFGLATELFGDAEGETRASVYHKKMKRINIFVQRGGGKKEQAKAYWSSFDEWPQTTPRYLMLGPKHETIIADSIASGEDNKHLRGQQQQEIQFSEFRFDPWFPAMTSGGNNLILIFLGLGCGSMNQRKVMETRPDVLVFSQPSVLEQDLVLTGQVRAVVYISTNGYDADVFVSLNDVYVDENTGEEVSMQIRSGMQRLRATPEGMKLDTNTQLDKSRVYRVDVDMWFTSYVVPKGHRLRVVISSSSSPYYGVNLSGGHMFQLNRVHYSIEHPSHVELPVIDDLSKLPRNDNF